MPFCSQCGNQVEPAARFCARCGSRQPIPGGEPSQPVDALAGISPRTASILCYVPGLGWIASIIVLAANRFRADRNVRFHAFQGLYLFVAWLLDDWVLRPMMFGAPRVPLHHLIQAALLGMSIFMMVKAAHNEPYRLPLFGELAEKSMAEQ
jgi:uncharacterized membrane protein